MPKFTRILSIDGGGIRGIIPGQILVVLEEKLKQITNNQNAKIADFFDMIAGTSTGGILTCLYLCPDEKEPTRPKYSAKDSVDIYLNRSNQIFSIPFIKRFQSVWGIADEKYPSAPIEALIREYVKDVKLSELVKPSLITAYDIQARKATFFTQHDARKTPNLDFYVRDVARATSAAPTFFEAARITSLAHKSYPLIDGGVFANNPALCAYAEARTKLERNFKPEQSSRKNPIAKDMLILSLGTGDIKEPYEYESVKDWGKIQWVTPILSIIMTGVAETVDYQLQQMFEAAQKPEQYLRINPRIPKDSPMAEMDNVESENLKNLRKLANKTAAEHSEKLDKFIELLLAE